MVTTINCSSNCVHQEDGKCCLDSIPTNSVAAGADCVFFQEKQAKGRMDPEPPGK